MSTAMVPTDPAVVLIGEPSRQEIDAAGVVIPHYAYTFEGFRTWTKSPDFPKRGRFSFIQGRVYADITMEEIETHNKIKSVVTHVLFGLVREQDAGEFYSDGVRVVNTDAGVSHEPDAAFVSWESFEAGRAHAIPREGFKGQFMEIEGSPDWHMEIVSEGSVTKDKRQLPESYHKAGVREYWLIDARGADIQFQILINTPTGYQPAETKDGWQFSVVFQRWFKLERTRGKLDRWRYSLLVREQV